MTRTLVLLILAAGALAPARAEHALPDLAVRRDGFARQGDSLRIVVENLGATASSATELELSDRPFLGGVTGTSSQYRPVYGQEAVWIDREPAGDEAIQLTIHLGRGRKPFRSRGTLQFREPTQFSLESARAGVQVEAERSIAWDIDLPPKGTRITLRVAAVPGSPPDVRVTLPAQEKRLAPRVYTAEGEAHGQAILTLDCLDRPRARRLRIPVPELDPGARHTAIAEFVGGDAGDVVAWVDPDDAVDELREGNNASTWTATRDRWTLAGLHVHSCFSEGPGSFDWQACYAALSGYDLLWWSEHDWRVGCRDHLERLGFESAEPLKLTFDTEGAGSVAESTTEEPAEGRRALRLATGASGGRAEVRVKAVRKRFAYALASDLDLTVRMRARSLQAGDVLRVIFELSRHPGEQRRIVYALRWEGSDVPEEDIGVPAGTHVIPGSLPTGGWVPVRLPLSRDAQTAWPNGLDNNLIGMRFELEAAAAAEVLVDDVQIVHDACGEELLNVEREWTRSYPNLRHEVGGEVSHGSPHLARYGGDVSLLWLDMERGGAGMTTEETVKVVHGAAGVVSWCHPLGVTVFTDIMQEQVDQSVRDGLAGVDAVEIGYRARAGKTLRDYLDLWKHVNDEGVIVTALGVNDSHHDEWAPWENNFATWLEAPAGDTAALLRALRTGRAFFGDPVRFRGRLDLQVGGARMGDVVAGEGPRAVRIRLSDVGENRTVRLIADGALLREWTGITGSGVLGEQLAPGQARAVRAEVWTADGDPLAFTNPIVFDPTGSLRRGGE